MKVLNAYTGKAIDISVGDILSLSQFHELIHESTQIPSARQLLLIHPSAAQLKLEAIVPMQVVYLYDKEFISNPETCKETYGAVTLPAKYASFTSAVPDPADSPTKSFFDARQKWAMISKTQTDSLLQWIASVDQATTHVNTAADLAWTHMNTHLKTLTKTIAKRRKLSKELKVDLETCAPWESNWDKLEKIIGDKLHILDKVVINDAYERAQSLMDEVTKTVSNAELELDELERIGESPPEISSMSSSTHQPSVFLQDMVALCSKIAKDCAQIVGLPDDQYAKLAPKVLKNHQEIIPEIQQVYKEILAYANESIAGYEKAQERLLSCLKTVTSVQSRAAAIKQRLNAAVDKMHKIDKLKNVVAKVIDFPFIYGVVLIELNRRRSWAAALRHITDSANEQVEELRKQEYRRIDKWISHYSSLSLIDKLISVDVVLPTIEVTTKNFDEIQDEMDISTYLEKLKDAGMDEVCIDLRAELEAMSAQLERSFQPSKSMLLSRVVNISSIRERELEKEKKLLQEERKKFEAEKKQFQETVKQPAPKQTLETRPELDELRKENTSLKAEAEYLKGSQEKLSEEYQTLTQTSEELKRSYDNLEERYKVLKDEYEDLKSNQEGLKEQADTKSESNTNGNTQVTNEGNAEHDLVALRDRAYELSQRLFVNSHNLNAVLEGMGLQASKTVEEGIVRYKVNRVRGLGRRNSRKQKDGGEKDTDASVSVLGGSSLELAASSKAIDPKLLYWVQTPEDDEKYQLFVNEIYIDFDIFRQSVCDRFSDVEKIARKYHAEVKSNREKIRQLEQNLRHRLALSNFEPGDLILFLPTRDPERLPNPWAAFNVNSPHYFLDPKNAEQLGGREYLIGRATSIVQYQAGSEPKSNPFGLPKGTKWNMITASWK